jgi:hypothetical protein
MTANTPFAMEAEMLGLTGSNPALLTKVLGELKTQDPGAIQAIVTCMDPNNAPVLAPGSGDGGGEGGAAAGGGGGVARSLSAPPSPQYGCSMQRSAPGGKGAAGILAIISSILLASGRRRRHA